MTNGFWSIRTCAKPSARTNRTSYSNCLKTHGPEQVAAALARRFRAGRSAPEELLDAPGVEEKGKRRDDFKDGVWFSLSTGHQQNAEPRWLLPMLCRFGNITKRDIGAIKINQTDTYVELAPGSVERFLEGVGPSLTLEKTITLTRLAGIPDGVRQRGGKPYGKKKAYAARHDAHAKAAPGRVVELEPDKAPAGKGPQDEGPRGDKPGGTKPRGTKTWEKTAKKTKGKNSTKKPNSPSWRSRPVRKKAPKPRPRQTRFRPRKNASGDKVPNKHVSGSAGWKL